MFVLIYFPIEPGYTSRGLLRSKHKHVSSNSEANKETPNRLPVQRTLSWDAHCGGAREESCGK